MGQELSTELGARITAASGPSSKSLSTPAARGKVAWRALDLPRVVPASPVAGATHTGTAALAPSAPATGEIVDVTWSAMTTEAATIDPEEIIATVWAERAAIRGGFDHPHAESGCGFCRRAVAAYR